MLTNENHKRFGVLDIGSNSIRLVVFRNNTRIPLIDFNEKAFCGLGTELQISGKLSEKGKLIALDNISRFAEIIEKMVDGRVRKFLSENSLTEQAFVKDPDTTVGKLVTGAGAEVLGFTRFEVGEGIEVEKVDFAAEVAAQLGN